MWHSSRRRTAHRRLAVSLALVALACAGCSSTDPHASSPTTSTATVPGDCTTPVPSRRPLRAMPSDGRWFGHDGLWIDVAWTRDPRRVSAGGQEPGVVAGVKYATVTLRRGRFTSAGGPPTITARELGSGRTLRGETGGYAFTDTFRWWPSVLAFPATGCWEVRTTWGDTTVRFRVPLR